MISHSEVSRNAQQTCRTAGSLLQMNVSDLSMLKVCHNDSESMYTLAHSMVSIRKLDSTDISRLEMWVLATLIP